MKLTRTFGRTAKLAAGRIASIEARGGVNTARVEAVVTKILAEVRQGGDDAVKEYATRFDALGDKPLRVSTAEMEAAWKSIAPALQAAMKVAQANIRAFAERQMPGEWTFEQDGLTTGQIVRPLGSVACYVPGGRYPYPSTVLMTATPARVAGVTRVVMCSPNPKPETLAAAHLAGVTEFYRMGGAQAIAAVAFGTESIRPVEKIVGPGNLYVTVAKQMVAQECGIDMPAGPTEIGVMSEAGDAEGIAADLVAQAEHDPESLAVLITPNEVLAEQVLAAVTLQAKGNAIARQSLDASGSIFVTKTVTEARELVNRLSFEHLSVDRMSDVAWVTTAGSVFVGRFSPQSMGDYLSGPNHVLPTARAGRMRGGLSVQDFVKVITVQQYTRKALAALGPHAIALAEAEGLAGACGERSREAWTPEEGGMMAMREKEQEVLQMQNTGPRARAAVVAMPEYHPPLAARDALRLDFNENTVAPSPRVVKKLGEMTGEALTTYPERGRVERIVARHAGLADDQVLLTNGVDEAIHLVCCTFLEAEDEALIYTPGFFMYDVSIALMAPGGVRRVQADETLGFDLQRYMAAITPRTKLMIVASPNNPTGATVPREQLLEIAAAAPNAVLMVDEAYFHFHGATTLGDVGSVPNLLVTRTFSKAYGLANLRVGMIAGDARLLNMVRKVASPYNVNGIALAVLPEALDDEAYLAWYVEQVRVGRARVMAGLDALRVGYFPSEANFVLMRIGRLHAELVGAMRGRGVLLRDRSTDPGCEGLVRMTVGVGEQVTKGLDALRLSLAEIGWTA